MFIWNKTVAIVAIIVLSCAGLGRAGILDNGFVTLDTETGLEWLDMSFTRAGFPAQWLHPGSVLPGFIKPGVPAGFRVASEPEVLSLFAAVGVAPDLINNAAAFTAVDTLLTFMTPLGEVDNRSFLPNGISGNRYFWFRGATSTSARVNPWDDEHALVGYWVRVDENYSSNKFTAIVQREDGSGFTNAHNAFATGNDVGTFLVRNRSNGTPSTAVAPTSSGNGSQAFSGVNGNGVWFDVDPAGEPAIKFTADAPSLFTAVGLPASFTDADDLVSVVDPSLGVIELGPGEIHYFSSPVMMFELSGLVGSAPAVGAPAAGAFSLPLLLQLDQETAGFTVAAVPEPTTMLLLAGGAVALVRRRRVVAARGSA